MILEFIRRSIQGRLLDTINNFFAVACSGLEQDFAGSGNPRSVTFVPHRNPMLAGGVVDLVHVPQGLHPVRRWGGMHPVVERS